MLKKILVPLDQSAVAEQALGTALAIARASSAHVELIVAHRSASYDGSMTTPWTDAKGPEEAEYLRRLADEIARGSRLVVHSTVATGKPVEAICRHACESQSDLIVMTSHGRTGFSRVWLGSVADGVVRRACVPVLMLRASEPSPQLGSGHPLPLFKSVLVPIDGSDSSTAIVESAARVAQCGGATLILVRVVAPSPLYIIDPQVPAYPTMIIDPEATKTLADAAKEELGTLSESIAREYGLKTEAIVEVGSATAATILQIAAAHNADLIAMTTHGRGASRLVLGSVTDKVLRGGHLPMLLLHPGTAQLQVRKTATLASNDAVRRTAALPENRVTA